MSDTEVEELTPKLFDHAKRVFEEMKARSHKEQVIATVDEELEVPRGEVDIYEGHLTRLFAELSIPNPYYTKIMDILKAQNCVEQLRRGGGVALSRWILLEAPTEEGFKILTERKRVPKGQMKILEQRQRDLMGMVEQLTTHVENLEEAFQRLYDDVMTMKRAA